jgi:hypothetical protein
MRPPASSLFTRMADSVEALAGLLERMEMELPEKVKHGWSAGSSPRGSVSHGPAWNAAVAFWVTEVHQGLRELERDVAYSITGRLRPLRGGSDGNTLKAASVLPALTSGTDYHSTMAVVKQIESWVFRGRLLLGDLEPFARLPRLPGQPAPCCPFCKSQDSLRYRPATGQVRCLMPACRDSQGNRPMGQMEVGAYSGEPMLAWSDGSTGVPQVVSRGA